MASVSTTCLGLQPLLSQSLKTSQAAQRASLKMVSMRWEQCSFHSLKASRLRVCCMAKPETVDKVCEIVRKQLALTPETVLTPDTTFAKLGADSLDTVEIVMGLEEEYDINVEEENSQNITTIQDAADLIEKLVENKGQAAAPSN
ncbi:hypothetical protein Tsubulata_000643 [Turnera subulata]|uniref:Acyl carrier protein n=1 Tax=Turnera subulata TaxID=218843 RepID=A0A9Q0JR81_9ROSI|nr:hypothetical protein Tsubulata_000643 [Turnera subulata]